MRSGRFASDCSSSCEMSLSGFYCQESQGVSVCVSKDRRERVKLRMFPGV